MFLVLKFRYFLLYLSFFGVDFCIGESFEKLVVLKDWFGIIVNDGLEREDVGE